MAAAEKLSSDELFVGPAPIELAERIILSLEAQVQKALHLGFDTHTLSDVVAAIHSRDMQLWNAIRGGKVIGIEITEILKFPRKTVCNLFLTAASGHTLRQWGPALLEQIEGFARAQGCDMVTGRGRIGWKKLAEGYGFNKPFILSAKRL